MSSLIKHPKERSAVRKEELEEKIMDHADTLYRVSCGLLNNPQDREDAVQSAVEIAWCKAYHLRDESKLKTWLVRVLINECYSILRKHKREIPSDMEFLGATDIPQESIQLREALAVLPEEMRTPLVLHYFEGMSIKEIAFALRRPQGTVLSRMHRGRQALKTLLEEEDHG